MLGQTTSQAGTSNFTLASFNEKAFAPISSIVLNGLLGSPIALASEWSTGLALLFFNDVIGGYGGLGYGGPAGMLYLFTSSSFVAPAPQVDSSASVPGDIQLRWSPLSRPALAAKLRGRGSLTNDARLRERLRRI